ncbi:MAG: ATP-binding domain-containing protein [Ignavibacteria bacterium]|nr:ATP-binding domain-containing protein [Ignavibacteria bacterium]
MVSINSRHIDNVTTQASDAITLSTINAIVRKINKQKLDDNTNPLLTYKAVLDGKLLYDYNKVLEIFKDGKISEEEFERRLDSKFPTDVELKLKKNTQVVMVKNDPAKRWANGSLGKVTKIDDNSIKVKINNKVYSINRETWEQIDYQYDIKTEQLKSNSKGKFIQYPLKPAYAMTIHKSQGKTFDKVVVYIASGAFAHGQIYVALSRCTTLEGLTLNREITQKDVIVDQAIVNFIIIVRTKFNLDSMQPYSS